LWVQLLLLAIYKDATLVLLLGASHFLFSDAGARERQGQLQDINKPNFVAFLQSHTSEILAMLDNVIEVHSCPDVTCTGSAIVVFGFLEAFPSSEGEV
jgi:hypothetical protein